MQCGRFGSDPPCVAVLTKCSLAVLVVILPVWPFWPIQCGRFGCGRFGSQKSCGRFGCGRFGVWPFWPGSVEPTSSLVWADVILLLQLKECKKLHLCKNPSWNMHFYPAKSLRFESTDFASVMIDVPGVICIDLIKSSMCFEGCVIQEC